MNIINHGYDPAVLVSSIRMHPQNPREGDVGAICQSIDAKRLLRRADRAMGKGRHPGRQPPAALGNRTGRGYGMGVDSKLKLMPLEAELFPKDGVISVRGVRLGRLAAFPP